MRHEWQAGGTPISLDRGDIFPEVRYRSPGGEWLDPFLMKGFAADVAEEVLRLAPRSVELALFKSILETEGRVAGTAEGLRKLIADHEAASVAADEGLEIVGEMARAMAAWSHEDLSPCVDLCAGHLGPKAAGKYKAALAAWRGMERKVGEQAVEIERLREWLEEIGPCRWDRGDGEVGFVSDCRRWLHDVPDEGSRCPKCRRTVKIFVTSSIARELGNASALQHLRRIKEDEP